MFYGMILIMLDIISQYKKRLSEQQQNKCVHNILIIKALTAFTGYLNTGT